MTAVRAITFDFWCTLFRDHDGEARKQVRLAAFSKATGVPEDTVDKALRHVWREFTRHHIEEQRTLGPEDAIRLTAQLLGITVPAEAAPELARVFGAAIVQHSPVPIEGALDAVRAAAGRFPAAVISDTGVSPGTSLRQLLDRHAFTNLFKALVFSDEVGVAKPCAPMFETAARVLGVSPAELLHIGDIEQTDIAGAKAVGAKACLFLGAGGREPHATQADYTLMAWEDFPTVLASL